MKQSVDRVYALLWYKETNPKNYDDLVEGARLFTATWDDRRARQNSDRASLQGVPKFGKKFLERVRHPFMRTRVGFWKGDNPMTPRKRESLY